MSTILEKIDRKIEIENVAGGSEETLDDLKALRVAVEALEQYTQLGSYLERPDNWNSFKAGGPPEIDDYEEVEMSPIAVEALKRVEELLS